MHQLREYQADLLSRGMQDLERGRHVLLQLPTGAGKTVLGASIAAAFDGRVAIIAHRHYLVQQWMETLGREDVHYQTTQSFARSRERLDADLLVIDEAHHLWRGNAWGKAALRFKGLRLGLTATPRRTGKGESMADLFGVLHCGPSKDQLISDGYLVPLQVTAGKIGMVGGVVRAGEYTDAGIYQANNVDLMTSTALQDWQRCREGRRTIIYCIDLQHAESVHQQCVVMGQAARLVIGSTPETERQEIFQAYRDGAVDTLIGVAVLTEGLDLPECECIVLLRPTKSDNLWLQMCGRAQRLGKAFGMVLDYTDNHQRLLHPDEDRRWSLQAAAQGGEGREIAIPTCMSCGFATHVNSRRCRQCGYEPVCSSSRCVGLDVPVYPYRGGEWCRTCDILLSEAGMNGYLWEYQTPWHKQVKMGFCRPGQWLNDSRYSSGSRRWMSNDARVTDMLVLRNVSAIFQVYRFWEDGRGYRYQGSCPAQGGQALWRIVGEDDAGPAMAQFRVRDGSYERTARFLSRSMAHLASGSGPISEVRLTYRLDRGRMYPVLGGRP